MEKKKVTVQSKYSKLCTIYIQSKEEGEISYIYYFSLSCKMILPQTKQVKHIYYLTLCRGQSCKHGLVGSSVGFTASWWFKVGRIRLPMQETHVQSWVRKDCLGKEMASLEVLVRDGSSFKCSTGEGSVSKLMWSLAEYPQNLRCL